MSGSKIRKGLVYLCKECNERARIAESSMNARTHKGGYDFFSELMNAKNR